MKKILVADPIAQDGIDILMREAEVDVRTGLAPAELLKIIPDYQALVVRSETKVTAEVFAAGKQLQAVGRAGVGVDNIDLAAATERGVIVVNAPLGNTISAAEHAIGLMLALARHIPEANASLKAGEWKRSSFKGYEVRGKTLGLVGLGNVGSEVAKRAKGLDMIVVAHDPYISAERAAVLGVELASSLDELLSRADFLSLHTVAPRPDHRRARTAEGEEVAAADQHRAREPRRLRRARHARSTKGASRVRRSTSSRRSRRIWRARSCTTTPSS